LPWWLNLLRPTVSQQHFIPWFTLGIVEQLQSFPLWSAAENCAPQIQWEPVQQWINLAVTHLEASHSGAVLASLGIDVIPGQGEFCRKPSPGFIVGGRFLSSRSYLLATGTQPLVPAIEGLDRTGYLTAETLPYHLSRLQEGQHLAVLGQEGEAIALAQGLNRLGFSITLLAETLRILPEADIEVARGLQAQLVAAGIRVLTGVQITQIRSIQGKKWIQVDSQGIEVDELVLAVGQAPRVESLNLEAVRVKWERQGIWHNAKLQTTNPKIYACEGRVGTECHPHIACYEAAIALKNALFFPRLRAAYGHLPLMVHTQPEAAWIGLTEAQAISKFGKQVRVLRRAFNTLPKAQLQDHLGGFCKLIVDRNGRILGAHLLGDQASEWSGAIALAMQQNLKIQTLSQLVMPSPTWAEILHGLATDWQTQQLDQKPWLQNLCDSFFDLRRSWSKG
jgi:pyruvate/2-oxoglutarate dehydrogenase complex dihydrolipoamide dehydrogenase (E3) component